jgi:hypothetical protein
LKASTTVRDPSAVHSHTPLPFRASSCPHIRARLSTCLSTCLSVYLSFALFVAGVAASPRRAHTDSRTTALSSWKRVQFPVLLEEMKDMLAAEQRDAKLQGSSVVAHSFGDLVKDSGTLPALLHTGLSVD